MLSFRNVLLHPSYRYINLDRRTDVVKLLAVTLFLFSFRTLRRNRATFR